MNCFDFHQLLLSAMLSQASLSKPLMTPQADTIAFQIFQFSLVFSGWKHESSIQISNYLILFSSLSRIQLEGLDLVN